MVTSGGSGALRSLLLNTLFILDTILLNLFFTTPAGS